MAFGTLVVLWFAR